MRLRGYGGQQCVKSALLTQLFEKYKLVPMPCVFMNFEEPRLISERDSRRPDRIATNFCELRGLVESYLFDEV